VRIAPEVAGQLATIKVHKGDRVRAGDVVAELSATELTASVGQARAALAAATADRNNVYAGVREEQIASLAAEIAKAKSRLEYAEQQLTRTTYLTGRDTASQQALDQATNDAASARADVAEAQVNHDAAVAGPTKEERAIADAQQGGGTFPYAPPDRSKNPPAYQTAHLGDFAWALWPSQFISDSSMRRGLNNHHKTASCWGRRPPLLEQSVLAARKSLATVVRPWLKCSQ
jgi:multidrug efflux pump subunit AcrA (membrane-fusion protein)